MKNIKSFLTIVLYSLAISITLAFAAAFFNIPWSIIKTYVIPIVILALGIISYKQIRK